MSDFPSRRLPLFPLITAAIFGGIVAWMYSTGHVVRSFGTIALTLLWLLLTGFWWALRVKGRKKLRLGVLILVVAALAIAFNSLLRYDGSADGTAMPRFTWRWSKEQVPAVLSTEKHAEVDLSSFLAGLADSPRFMGPHGDGSVPAATFDTNWKSRPPREAWRKPAGTGWSGFSVAGRRAITLEQRGDMECVTCYDIASGSLLWMIEDQARFSEKMGGDGPRATPAIDVENKLVFTMGGTGIVNCIDLESGGSRWSRNVLSENNASNLTWGKSCSPLLHGPHVIVSGGTTQATLLALRRDTGAVAWQSSAGSASYSSPVVLKLRGREQIVSVNAQSVTGHDPGSGEVLWSFPWPGEMPKSSQPIAAGPDRILVTASYGMKSHLLEFKGDAAGNLCPATVWSSSAPRTKFSSVSVVGGFAYGIDEGTLACVDLSNGERRWRAGRYGYGQHLLANGLMLIQAEPGFVALVKPNPDRLEEIARLPALNSMTWNPPTLAGRWLLVRNDREAVCFELHPPQ